MGPCVCCDINGIGLNFIKRTVLLTPGAWYTEIGKLLTLGFKISRIYSATFILILHIHRLNFVFFYN